MLEVRPEIAGFTAYSPGLSIDEIKARYGLAKVIKMASNENPLGASPMVQRVLAARAGLVFRYPQSGNPKLTRRIAEHLGVRPECVVTGNGSDELIDLVMRIKARPGQDHILTCQPSFSIYRLQARLCGVEVRTVALPADFSLPLDALAEAAGPSTAMVFLTNPDNPSGAAVKAEDIERLARSLPEQTLLVVDEAYIDFAEPFIEHTMLPRLARLGNVVILRTFSKAYGLAGLRLGYGVMPEWLAELMLRVKLPFSVNLLAEEAGMAALEDTAFHAETLATVARGRLYLAGELARLGCSCSPSQANFIMFEPPCPALEVFEELLRLGFIIRPLKSYGLPGLLRVSVGNDEENRLFVDALTQVLSGRKDSARVEG